MNFIKLEMCLVLMLFWGCAKTPVFKSTWQQPSFQLDGNDEDWAGQMYYDNESGIMYGLSNDHEKLYVKLQFSNQILQQKVLKTGLTFWIDTVGKKKKQLGLIFPTKSQPHKSSTSYRTTRMEMKQIDTAIFNTKYREGSQNMILVNYFGNGREDLIDNKNKEGINAILKMDTKEMLYYEAEISLQKIFPDPQKFLNDTTQHFSFGIETGKIEMPASVNGGDGSQMGVRGGGGRGGGMGGRGGQRGGGTGDPKMDPDKLALMQAMSVESKVWVKKASLSSQ